MVKKLDISEKIALCYEANLHYYTKTRDYTDIDVLGGDIVCLALKSLFFFLCFSTCI
jgi:DEAD/DEAH box helicase domain-containing protein